MGNLNQKPFDENGKAHGEWLWHHDNGQIMYRENYFHGFRHGLYELYFDDGVLEIKGTIKMDQMIGFWCSEYINEKLFYLCLI